MTNNNLTIGEKINELRKNKGVNQEQFGDDMNVTRQTVSRWESNTNIPDMEKINEIAKYFNVSTSYLLDEKMSEIETVSNNEVKKIVDTYITSINEEMEKNEKSRRRESLVMKIISVVLSVCILCSFIVFKIENRNLTYNLNSMSNEISSLQRELNNHIQNSNYTKPVINLEYEHFSGVDVKLGDYDLVKNTVEVVFNLTLKEFSDSTKVTISINNGTEIVSKELVLNNGSVVNDVVDVPLSNKFAIIATVEDNGVKRNEIFDNIINAYGNSLVSVGDGRYACNSSIYVEREEIDWGEKPNIKTLYAIGSQEFHFSIVEPDFVKAENVAVSVYKNGEFYSQGEVMTYDEYREPTGWGNEAQEVPPNENLKVAVFDDIKMKVGDTIEIFIDITDSAGRESSIMLENYELVMTGNFSGLSLEQINE